MSIQDPSSGPDIGPMPATALTGVTANIAPETSKSNPLSNIAKTDSLSDAFLSAFSSETTTTGEKPAIADPFLTLPQLIEHALSHPHVSDIHLRAQLPPIYRISGEMQLDTTQTALTANQLEEMIASVLPLHLKKRLNNQRDADFGFEVTLPSSQKTVRLRANVLYGLNNPGMVLRVVATEIPRFDTLGLPLCIKRFADFPKGLVLFTGATGSGKSTTLASLLSRINERYAKHIITLEDPIEFLHAPMRSLVTQREVGVDTPSYADGLKYALREDPDVILIGEIRDRQTLTQALQAAETGHLVFATLHTSDTVKAIYRLLHLFEPHERDMVRLQLAQVLQAIVAQTLLRRRDGQGRLPVAEVLVANLTVRDYIARNQIDEIGYLLSNSQYDDMNSMNTALLAVIRQGLVSEREALNASENVPQLVQMLKGAFHGTGG